MSRYGFVRWSELMSPIPGDMDERTGTGFGTGVSIIPAACTVSDYSHRFVAQLASPGIPRPHLGAGRRRLGRIVLDLPEIHSAFIGPCFGR